jgi:hypothetical protein
MKKSLFAFKGYAAPLLISTLVFLMSCSVTAMPDKVPLVKGVETVSFAGVSLAIENAEQDSLNYDIPTDRGTRLGFIGNRKAWSKKLIDTLAGELAKRGASIAPQAPLKLAVSLPEIVLIQNKDLYQFKVTVAVSSRGWTKKYEASAESSLAFFESADTMASRVAGQALMTATKAMLADAEFRSQVRAKNT